MYYKDLQNKLHAIDKIEDAHYLPADCVPITDVEADAIRMAANPPPPPKTVLELDIEKYKRRANAKPLLMAKMAAMNVGRLKAGEWTTAQLITLMADPEIKSLVSHMETLSFELAIGVVNSLTNPLITPAIKSTWVAELVAAL
jgi:hypothetical protein